jgi:hypothetical protein
VGSFVFPYSAAQQAVGAMEDLAARLRAFVTIHDGALDTAHVDFRGETRDQFDRDITSALDMLATFARYLDSDASELRSTISYAHRLEAAMSSP